MISSLGIGFVLGFVGSMPIAGAVSIFVFQRGLAGRVRDGLLLSAGAATAEALWCGVARYGAEQALNRWPAMGAIAEIFGGLILILLGIYFFRLKKQLPQPSIVETRSSREFGLGFLLVAGNIAIPLNWLALITVVFSLGFDPFSGPPGSFSIAVALGIMAWFTALILLLNKYRHRFSDNTLTRTMKAMGLLLIITGIIALTK